MPCFSVKTEATEVRKMFVAKKGLPSFPRGKSWNLADILESAKLISPLEKIALKEKINTYGDTL